MTDQTELQKLTVAKNKILDAIAAGATVVKSIEIRGRVIQHNDLHDELMKIERLITFYTNKDTSKRLQHGRNRARLRY